MFMIAAPFFVQPGSLGAFPKQRNAMIPTGERSGLLTRIAATEKVSLCELESVIRPGIF
jgi:hypothetical protein